MFIFIFEKTSSTDAIILMAKLEGKFPYNRWSPSTNIFLILAANTRFLGTQLQKRLIYLYIKKIYVTAFIFLEL